MTVAIGNPPPADPRAHGQTNGNGNGAIDERHAHTTLLLARVAHAAPRHVLVVGGPDDADTIRHIAATTRRTRKARPDAPLLATVVDGDVLEQLRAARPDEVYLVLGGALDETRAGAVGSRLLMDGVAVHLVMPELSGPPVHAEAVRLGRRFSLSLHATREGRAGAGVRRAVDLAGALLLVVLLSPLLVLIAALVWVRLGRPIVFVQQRIGRGGTLFPLYKFRSMVANAEAVLAARPELYRRYVRSNYKLPEAEDPRITPLGRFLRRTSLDELPQLWNVVRGDMSLVGPRPIVPDEIAEYGDWGRLLLRAKPGLTGLWQVSGRSDIDYPERARMELGYVGERSIRRDLEILLRTVPAVLLRRGAL